MKRADHRQHAEQQDDRAGQEHVLRDQRLQQQRPDRRQASTSETMMLPETSRATGSRSCWRTG